jgi:hypothetical protein
MLHTVLLLPLFRLCAVAASAATAVVVVSVQAVTAVAVQEAVQVVCCRRRCLCSPTHDVADTNIT